MVLSFTNVLTILLKSGVQVQKGLPQIALQFWDSAPDKICWQLPL